MGERILEGSLRTIYVPDVLTFVNMLKKTGILTLRNQDQVRKLYWEKGELVFASSSLPTESLGSFLVRHGRITQDEHEESGRRVEPGTRQGKVLVQMGILTPKQLWWAVKNQVLEIVYDLFSLKEGLFFFEETEEINEEKIKLSTSTTNIIMEGIRRLDEWPRIREFIPTDEAVPTITSADSRDKNVKFMEGELEILSLVDGERTVREIIHASPLDEFETLRILMALVLARYISMPGAPESHGEDDHDDSSELGALVARYNEIYARIGSELSSGLSAKERKALFTSALTGCEEALLEGCSFNDNCELQPRILTANVADLRANKRAGALRSTMENLLSFLLFEASKHLDADQRGELYRLVEEQSSTQA